MKLRLSLLSLFAAFFVFTGGRVKKPEPTAPAAPTAITAKVAAMKALPGFIPLYWDAKAGKMWLEIARLEEEFLSVDSLPAGLGSNDIGLDRGQLGRERVVRFTRQRPENPPR